MGYTNGIGKYQLIRTIGEGMFAKVKLAVNTENGQKNESEKFWKGNRYLSFDDLSLVNLYLKILRAQYAFPEWFTESHKKLISRILDPNPRTLIAMSQDLDLSGPYEVQVIEVAPTHCVMEISKSDGELGLYREFCKSLSIMLTEETGVSTENQAAKEVIAKICYQTEGWLGSIL
ncbi:hypothetical protein RHMOL_Rhmol06G0194700 [Rhododendron molle]|uniref:Uncharacterized protein n=1 Tax=Rhododendron molle TaxID=49168 RepID=A0ACC0NE77_RHOML|nr:hypothetical protein RHMOL_Rhmol06G0194700 [Rhododendron molle]